MKAYARLYQAVFRLILPRMPWRQPELIKGEGSVASIGTTVKAYGVDRALLVSDPGLVRLGFVDQVREHLEKANVRVVVYDKTQANPTIDQIEEALLLYREGSCQGIVALGGGSPMDLAKAVGARIAMPNKTIPQLKGILKIKHNLPPLFAIPTTAGTGSEVTVAAVVTDSKTKEKYAISDLHLIPILAIHDPSLTVGLPPHITATTGMDALTHAVEAYLNHTSMPVTNQESEEAVQLIFRSLLKAYENGNDIRAREDMQKAAFLAGAAFTKAYVGYVHGLAHQLGGFYGIPHGLANAVILPIVLDYYGDKVEKKLARLADVASLSTPTMSQKEKADAFKSAIKEMNRKMNIPQTLEGIKEEDLEILVKRALEEVNPAYPVPVILNGKQLLELYHHVMKASSQ
ncbi:MAG: alcohol dehydrogenase [Firmicutes bacterium GWF2_51_9]|nr:MAG: alcohol dehydrogenase [Firmicutes bacterium GWF2_51_9]OGS57441.1 MAG: alcohol dehydrogenase [Firmicutes bacterium GWE2_51_13]HAM63925.1 alcohol dehydrogenase [Erysipelotrichaceae bacterium]HAO62123.1 alcohol dehydrogenase [Erysipelotrichaceae bacterium]HBZ42043.1 alcohol dehydrogenase [Erysipelotrichaceae bacterium]